MNEEDRDELAAGGDRGSRWGRVKFGTRRPSALWVALPLGLILAVALALLALATGSAGPRPVVGVVTITVVTLWPCFGLVWALIVDRATLRGATENPEHSVESAWYTKAASGAFTDVLLLSGLALAAMAFVGFEVPAIFALSAVILVAMGSFAIRYAVQMRRG